jgi:hypothetical protein
VNLGHQRSASHEAHATLRENSDSSKCQAAIWVPRLTPRLLYFLEWLSSAVEGKRNECLIRLSADRRFNKRRDPGPEVSNGRVALVFVDLNTGCLPSHDIVIG